MPKPRSTDIEGLTQEQICRKYQRFVGSHAKRLCSFAPFEDLMQEGYLGLLRAAELFEPQRGLRFMTYAAHWVNAFMSRYIKRRPLVHAGVHSELKEPLCLSLNEWVRAPRHIEASEETWLERLESNEPAPDHELMQHALSQQIWDTINRLDFLRAGLPRAVVTQRLMRGVKLDELGREFGVSRERVRQVELRVRRLLAPHLESIRQEAMQ